MELVNALSQAFDHTHGVIAGVRADQMGNATPCSEWDVQALLGHAIGVVAGIGGAVRGEAPPADGAGFALADDAAAQFRSLADSTLAAWKTADLDQEINIGAGPMPGAAALSINLLDTATHAPLAAVQNSLRVKRNAELRAGSVQDDFSSQLKNAALTGALTFASFFAMFGPSAAAMLIVLILIHELGHVIAMRWAGIPIKGIYFIPFFGGVAVGADRYRSEVERGVVALMGPGFSLATTGLFTLLAGQSEDFAMRELALMSALLNGFNLLPIQPLDGGQIMQSLLSRLEPAVARAFHSVALLAGGAIALYLGSAILLMVLLLAAPSIASAGKPGRWSPAPIAPWEMTMLFAAYAATIVFYVAVFVALSANAIASAGTRLGPTL